MKGLNDLPVEVRQEVETREDAERFIRALHGQGLSYHFDDGAEDCLWRNGVVTRECARAIDDQVGRCYEAFAKAGADLQNDCPIGYLLKVHEAADELPEGFSL